MTADVSMAGSASASWSQTTSLRIDYWQYQLIAGTALASDDEPELTSPNGFVVLQRSHVGVLCGTNFGSIVFHVERHETEPTLDDGWDEVVEFGVDVAEGLTAAELAGGWPDIRSPLCGPGAFRVRLHARGRDAARAGADAGELLETHALLLWPAARAPLVVVRTSDAVGQLWRDESELSPPRQLSAGHSAYVGEPPSAGEGDVLVPRPEPAEIRRRQEAWRLEHHPARRYAPDLTAALDGLRPDRQLEVARFLVRRAYAEARLEELPWAPPALDALDSERSLPPPFRELGHLFDAFWPDPRRSESAVPFLHAPRPAPAEVNQQASALPLPITLRDAGSPLAAVLDVLEGALMVYGGDRYEMLLVEVAETFPELG